MLGRGLIGMLGGEYEKVLGLLAGAVSSLLLNCLSFRCCMWYATKMNLILFYLIVKGHDNFAHN